MLIVDGNDDICKVIGSILQVKGCATVAVRTCEDALKAIKIAMPDMVCCDIHLNGERSGLDLARIVRAEKQSAHLFLIGVSGYFSETQKEDALRAGFDMLFPKPVKFSDLTRAIETYLTATQLSNRESPSNLAD